MIRAHLPIRAGDSFVGVLTFEGYPNPIHFGVLEPILSTAVMMLAEHLQRSSDAVATLLEEMNHLGTPKASPSEVNSNSAQNGTSDESKQWSQSAPDDEQTLKTKRQGA